MPQAARQESKTVKPSSLLTFSSSSSSSISISVSSASDINCFASTIRLLTSTPQITHSTSCSKRRSLITSLPNDSPVTSSYSTHSRAIVAMRDAATPESMSLLAVCILSMKSGECLMAGIFGAILCKTFIGVGGLLSALYSSKRYSSARCSIICLNSIDSSVMPSLLCKICLTTFEIGRMSSSIWLLSSVLSSPLTVPASIVFSVVFVAEPTVSPPLTLIKIAPLSAPLEMVRIGRTLKFFNPTGKLSQP
mmetsp:Transcript_32651/g.49200  ORF Transcript_32651/g.49200 Transcript_32651/m.49200 type:complete len:250 (-) Transcript_32651:179-928(-)